jgi:hypothetical protein
MASSIYLKFSLMLIILSTLRLTVNASASWCFGQAPEDATLNPKRQPQDGLFQLGTQEVMVARQWVRPSIVTMSLAGMALFSSFVPTPRLIPLAAVQLLGENQS